MEKVMAGSRRDLMKATLAISVLSVYNARAQSGPDKVIGIIHTTWWDSEFDKCFKRGLSDSGWLPRVRIPFLLKPVRGHYGGTYKHDELRKAIKDHGNVDVIVAAGGGVAAAAAQDQILGKTPKFVFLVGHLPALSPYPSGAGGVVTNTPAQNPNRVQKLKELDASIDLTQVWLVQNFNSNFIDPEAAAWGNQNVFRFFEGEDNDPSKFDQYVQTLSRHNPSGLVVSSDPFFRMMAGSSGLPGVPSFTQALASLKKPICYPFKEFFDAAPTDASGKKTCNWLGPSLAIDFVDPGSNPTPTAVALTAYYQLGQKVGAFFKDPLTVGVVRWDGSNWV
jgi:hypothetical protein